MHGPATLWKALIKSVLIFAVLEALLLSSAGPGPGSNFYSALGLLRPRFPISTAAPLDAALDVGNLGTMIASHIVSAPKPGNEFRVLMFGDSSVWGIGLTPQQTLPGQLDALALKCGSRNIHTYNLSYPASSSTKDLMILDRARQFQPDLIIWMITWYTLMPKARAQHWLITQNPDEFYLLGSRFNFLPRKYLPPTPTDEVFYKNRALSHTVRYLLYNLITLSTGSDQIPGPPEVLPKELSADPTFEGLRPPALNRSQVSIDQVADFYQLAGKTPVLLVNEPTQVLTGVPNSDIRYNDYYPRWIFDQYRKYLGQAATQNRWNYLDLWNTFPASSFTDTPLHLTPEGEHQLAVMLAPALQKAC